MEYFVLKIICQRFLVLFLNKVIGKQCDSPCTTFTCCLHNINRCIDCSCKDSLSNTFCLKQSAMSHHSIQCNMFFFQKDIHSCLQCSKRSIKMHSHKVCKIKFAVRFANE